MTICPHGHHNVDGQRFCGECGARLLSPHELESIGKAEQLASGIETKVAELQSGRINVDEFEEFLEHPDAEMFALSTHGSRTGSPDGLGATTAPMWSQQQIDRFGSPGAAARRWQFRPSLLTALAASVGLVVGALGPWLTVMVLTVNGEDLGRWGTAALILGMVSCAALLALLMWPSGSFGRARWAVPLAWAPAIIGVACLSFSVPMIVRIKTIPKTHILGIPIGADVGWGLWLLAVSALALCVSAIVTATQVARELEPIGGQDADSWNYNWRAAAIIMSAVLVVAAAVLFGANWNSGFAESDSSDSLNSPPSDNELFPSFPSDRTTGVATTTPTTTTTTMTTAGSTLDDYIAHNHVQKTTVQEGQGPKVDLPTPEGWRSVGPTPNASYGSIIYAESVGPGDPPEVSANMFKLTGNVEPGQVLARAGASLRSIPGFEPLGADSDDQLSGFRAVLSGGRYPSDGRSRLIAQKTVVIPADGGVFVLQFTADGPESDMQVLMDATNAIDRYAKITSSAATTESANPSSTGLDRLQSIARDDRPFVASVLSGHWIAQVSSKRVGLHADGVTWDNSNILGEHMQLRQRYPDARLLWSGDWPKFSDDDFWVTIIGIPFPDQSSAQAWCTDHDLDSDHCFAREMP